MNFKTLVYSKGFHKELTHKLLAIADSSTWLEDLVDLIGDLDSDFVEDCDRDCNRMESVEEEKELVEEEYSELKGSIRDKIAELKKEIDEEHLFAFSSDLLEELSDKIEKYTNFKIKCSKVVGGIELPGK